MRHRPSTRVPWVLTIGLAVAVLVSGATIASFVWGSKPASEVAPEAGSKQMAQVPAPAGSGLDPTVTTAPEPSLTAPATTVSESNQAPPPAPAAQPNRPAQPADGSCSDVEVVFARGTGERPGLGILGTPLTSNLRQRLPGRTVTSYGVDYAAASDQSSAGPGATDMSRHIADVAGRCPQTSFVIGGYSQGGTVTDIAIGIRGASRTTGETIPASVASQVVAVVVFGNPLGLSGRTIETASPSYGPMAMSFCNTDDSVCGGGGAGSLPGSHLSYATNGSVPQAADFAAARVNAAG